MANYNKETVASWIRSFPSKLAYFISCLVAIDHWVLTNVLAASAVGLRAAFATSVAVQTWLASDLLAGGKTGLAAYARQLVFTTAGATPADAPATVLITGYGASGEAQSETLALAQTATTATSVKFYSSITSLVFAAGEGAAATIALGWAAPVGLPNKVKTAGAAGVAVIAEFTDGVPSGTRGTYVAPSANVPNGSVTFNTAPDGAHDYDVWYERDITP